MSTPGYIKGYHMKHVTRPVRSIVKSRIRTVRDLRKFAALILDCSPRSSDAAEARRCIVGFDRRIQKLTIQLRTR